MADEITQARENLEHKISNFLDRACPDASDEAKAIMTDGFINTFDRWAVAEPGDRPAVLATARESLIKKLHLPLFSEEPSTQP